MKLLSEYNDDREEEDDDAVVMEVDDRINIIIRIEIVFDNVIF
jgi:hypothetical protein